MSQIFHKEVLTMWTNSSILSQELAYWKNPQVVLFLINQRQVTALKIHLYCVKWRNHVSFKTRNYNLISEFSLITKNKCMAVLCHRVTNSLVLQCSLDLNNLLMATSKTLRLKSIILLQLPLINHWRRINFQF